MDSSYKPNVISLFSGAGGCSLGFQQAGYKVTFASDIFQDAIETYRKNFPNTRCERHDVVELDPSYLLNACNLKAGDLDVLIGGPPCQGFSTAGTRFWDDPRNALLKHYVRLLDGIRPKWFLMENVEGLLTTKSGEYITEAIKAFISLGYFVRLEKVYAQEHGVPQRRKRVIVVGNRLGLPFEFPEPIDIAKGSIFRYTKHSLISAIGDLANPCVDPNGSVGYSQPPQSEFQRYLREGTIAATDHYSPQIVGVLLERVQALGLGKSMKDLPEHLQHESFRRRSKRRVMDGTPSEKRGGAPSGIKRLVPEEPSLTITGASTREFVHPFQNRFLTLRECARIQTFPDWFIFAGNNASKIQQVGNAIPPLLARRFAEHIRNAYGFTSDSTQHDRGKLLGYQLTKASAMSPVLASTDKQLNELLVEKPILQQALF